MNPSEPPTDEQLSEMIDQSQGANFDLMEQMVKNLDPEVLKDMLGKKDYKALVREGSLPATPAQEKVEAAPASSSPASRSSKKRSSKPQIALNKLAAAIARPTEDEGQVSELAKACDVDLVSVQSEANARRLEEVSATLDRTVSSLAKLHDEFSYLTTKYTTLAHDLEVLRAERAVRMKDGASAATAGGSASEPIASGSVRKPSAVSDRVLVPPAEGTTSSGSSSSSKYVRKQL